MAEKLIKMTPTIQQLLSQIEGDVTPAIEAGMSRVLSVAEGHSLDEVPVLTSNLLNSITTSIANSGRSGVLKATADYAKFVHDGTKPHVIRPKTEGGVLAFMIGGRTVFAKKVNHPGTKANPFLQKGVDKTDLGAEFENGMQDYFSSRRVS